MRESWRNFSVGILSIRGQKVMRDERCAKNIAFIER